MTREQHGAKAADLEAWLDMVAATARQHNLTVMTRNVADFKPLGVAALKPFKSP